MKYFRLYFLLGILLSCQPETQNLNKNSDVATLFSELNSDKTTVDFTNKITESEEKNYFNYEYIYQGGGVAIGDINNDGLPDIYFSANETGNELYLNKGDLVFQNISEESGTTADHGWKTGVNMVDINADGLLDIYLCRSGWNGTTPESRRNSFYINKGNNKFVDAAPSLGLNDPGYSLHSAFFDYDNDGDLDVYITNHPYLHNLPLEVRLKKRTNPDEYTSDKLYRNNGDLSFTDVSKESGILNYGHSLGITTGDINNDGWTDIYICNDYKEPDWLYINQGDGTFEDQIKSYTGHVSYNSMGVDMADVNNDGFEDFFTTEMLPYDYERSKTSMASMDVPTFEGMKALGLHYQYMHNCLQLNSGQGYFSDISQMTSTAKTDWSWACIIEDFDNNGYRDIFVANGFKRDVFDKDYKKEVDKIAEAKGGKVSIQEVYELMPSTKLPNFIYSNQGGLKFDDKSKDWGLNKESLSQGAAYGDLDNDGDLDLVINNLDSKATIYRNNGFGLNYLNVQLIGNGLNKGAYQSKVWLYYGDQKQFHETKNARGYISRNQNLVHFGLGENTIIDSLVVVWPSKKITRIIKPEINQLISIKESESIEGKIEPISSDGIFKEMKDLINPPFIHREEVYNDYHKQVLLPHKFSQLGPFLSVGDIDGDDLDDFYVGGAKGQAGAVYLQSKDGDFELLRNSVFTKDAEYEDLGSCFFDFDGDKDLDLYVTSGGNEFPPKSKFYQDRLYLNDGSGIFTNASDRIPNILSSTSCVRASDFDADGDIDLFVGGKIFPDHYPLPTPSYLLENKDGVMIDQARLFGLDLLGMISDAEWLDLDQDGDQDLLVVGEWTDLLLFENNGKDGFRQVNREYGINNNFGWWYSITKGDIDNDGDEDFVIGNVGQNHKFKASNEKPFKVFSGDYDHNGSYDIVLAKIEGEKDVPIRGKQCTSEQMPFIKNKFETYNAFAEASVQNIIGEKSELLQANKFSTIVLLNKGESFEIVNMPMHTQISATMTSLIIDIDNNGENEIITAGNMHQTEAETTRLDASIGSITNMNGKGTLKALPSQTFNYKFTGDIKDIQAVKMSGGTGLLVATNNDELKFYKLSK